MNYENWISYRYLTEKKGGFLAFLNFISTAGVAIGVMALILVIGIMEGFGNNLREQIIGTTPHVMIEKETGIRDYQELKDQIKTLEHVKGASAYIQGNIFLESSGQAVGLIVRGVEPESEYEVTKVNQYIEKGSFQDLHGDSIIIGQELARYFGFKIGDKVVLISPGSGVAGQGWRYALTIVGIFSSGRMDYDMNLALVNVEKAQEIFNVEKGIVTGIGVKLTDPYSETILENIKPQIRNLIGYSYYVKTWKDDNIALFKALALEKLGLFLILMLMVMVASFNIVSTLIVTVTSKIHDIGILQSIGVPKSAIRRIFIKQGLLIGIRGIVWGLIWGVGISYLLKNYFPVPRDIYATDHVPVDLKAFDVMVIVTSALVISYLATLYPASRAAKLQPVDALRYQ
ncbi:MAG: ABC transporter permease [Candidatus Omnitrophica bacterium]|nr:ABC transporter permease [Candidatus Omnitrophota bacterium]